jgi:hypothetical protein
MRKAEREHLNKVSSLPCCLCGDVPTEVHHLREGQGMAQRAQHFLVIPLCPSCHRGPQGAHGDKTMFRIMKKDELDLLAETMEAVYG